MTTKYIFSNNNDFSAKYISRPGTGGYGGLLTFSFSKDGSTKTGTFKDVDKALLCSTVNINFGRTVGQMYFLNVSGTSYQIGRGTGSLQIGGMLGSANDFAAMFGTDYSDPCKNIFTVKLDAFGMMPCDGNASDTAGTIIMNGVIANSIQIGATVQAQDGTIWYTAGATFQIAGLGVDTQRGSAEDFWAKRQSL